MIKVIFLLKKNLPLRKQIMKRIVCRQNNFVGLRLLGTFN